MTLLGPAFSQARRCYEADALLERYNHSSLKIKKPLRSIW